MSKLGVGVIGADPRGFGERAHIPAAKSSARLELVAICTAHAETARAAAQRHDLTRWYTDASAMAADPDVDLVTIAVRPRFHRPLVEAVVPAGKPIYCEWPLARTTEEARQMAASVEEAGVATAVGLQGRFAPAIVEMKKVIEGGRIGRPLSFQLSLLQKPFAVHSDRHWLTRSEEASGALHVATAHVLDALQYVLGPVTRLTSLVTTRLTESTFVDTSASFTWETPDTVMTVAEVGPEIPGMIHVSNVVRPVLGFSFRVFGDGGQVVARAPQYFQFSPIELLVAEPDGPFVPLEVRSDGRDDSDPASNVARALEGFARAITSGSQIDPDFRLGVRLHELIDAVAVSSDAGSAWGSVPD